jgi:hypothetical protein
MTNSELLARFVGAFELLDDRWVSRADGTEDDMRSVLTAPWDEQGWSHWRPIRTDVPRSAVIEDLGGLLTAPLPSLYEQLIMSYRWAEVDLGRIRLLPNLPPGLKGLACAIRSDRGIYDALGPAGYFQFARGPGVDYDPVCFDLGMRLHDGDCRIVKFDHEQILCNGRLVKVAEPAPSFKRLIEVVIEDASFTGKR